MFPLLIGIAAADAGTTQKHYYAHDAVEDEHGVIAPWYTGQNGQLDLRIRIAAETLKRYPWTDKSKAVAALPEFIFSGAWKIAPDGTITIPPISDWANGDLGQRAAYVISGLIDYYRYSGDPAAIALVTLQADALLDYALTPTDHPWPEFLISVPTRGKPYGKADPRGFIQLDIVAEVGIALVHAAEMTGNQRWMKAAQHWGDLFAEKRSRVVGGPPWPRYANPECIFWDDHATGGVAFILEFLDALIRTGYTGKDGAILEARQAGVDYLRDVLLPKWSINDTWGRNYWDWVDNVQAENVTEFAARYVMEHPNEFPNWENDARNILGLFLNHASVNPGSGGDVYSGAWAYPESSSCCGRSLWYGPLELAGTYAQLGMLTGSEWARELARRQAILATYDVRETGVVEDNIDGGGIVADAWFKIAHPMALKYCLSIMAWQPEIFGPSQENHIVRSTAVICNVNYGDGYIRYRTADCPAGTTEVLRLAFRPTSIVTREKELPEADVRAGNGYEVKALAGGDYLVTVRHDNSLIVEIKGDDPQTAIRHQTIQEMKQWSFALVMHASSIYTVSTAKGHYEIEDEPCVAQSVSAKAGASASLPFTGNQARLIGIVGPDGGLAEVYLDGVKQPAGIDTWCPEHRLHQVLWYRNGLSNDPHTLKVVVLGKGNPVSKGARVTLEKLLCSAETTPTGFGSGGGPKDAQRMIFGYTGRTDYVDSDHHAWRPGTEFVIRSGGGADSVAASWYTQRRRIAIEGTDDPELYRYGVHGKDFWVDFTVGPGTYHARLKFAETRNIDPKLRAFNITINGREVLHGFDIAATAAGGTSAATRPVGWHHATWPGLNRAVKLVFNDIQPKNGVISLRFTGSSGGEAIVQAIEVGPGDGGRGATPVSTQPASSPRNDRAR